MEFTEFYMGRCPISIRFQGAETGGQPCEPNCAAAGSSGALRFSDSRIQEALDETYAEPREDFK